MKIDELTIGTKLVLRIGGKRDKPSLKLVSSLEWAEDSNSAYIAAPIHEGIIYPIHVDTVIDAFLIYKADSQNLELYSFKALVTDRLQKDNLSLLKIDIIGDLTRMQRRQYYRHTCSLIIDYRIIPEGPSHEEVDEEFKRTTTRDLSGGGLCFVTDEKIELGMIAECRLKLDDRHEISFIGDVVRRDMLGTEDAFKYSIGLKFKLIKNHDRELVIRHIFKDQRKLRQKGLM